MEYQGTRLTARVSSFFEELSGLLKTGQDNTTFGLSKVQRLGQPLLDSFS